MSMHDDYNFHKNDTFSKRDIISGILIIVQYAGAAVGLLTVANWVLSAAVPVFAAFGTPITLGTLMFGAKALNDSWHGLSADKKGKVIAALAWIGRGTDISGWFR